MAEKSFIVVDLNDKKEYQRLVSAPQQTHRTKCGRVFLEPGQSCGQHSTQGREEILVFLAGNGRATIGPEHETVDIGLGKIAYIPPYTVHDIENTGAEALIYVFIVTDVDKE